MFLGRQPWFQRVKKQWAEALGAKVLTSHFLVLNAPGFVNPRSDEMNEHGDDACTVRVIASHSESPSELRFFKYGQRVATCDYPAGLVVSTVSQVNSKLISPEWAHQSVAKNGSQRTVLVIECVPIPGRFQVDQHAVQAILQTLSTTAASC